MKKVIASRLVKSEDLNHHGTLFAGRIAEWFVENCFIASAKETGNPENIVCIKIHGLSFNSPVERGDIVNMESYIAKAGRTSLTVYGKVTKNDSDKIISDGFITFVVIDCNGNATPHNIMLDKNVDEEEMKTREMALKL